MTFRNAAVAAAVSAAGLAPAALPAVADATGIPARALEAYVTAAQSPEACPGMRWSVLAGIYRQESGHGTHGGSVVGPDGRVDPPIYGVPVDWLDGDRAQGPGQFMTSSWAIYGQGDPQDIDDAAMASVRHLCGTHGDLEGGHLRSAIVSYYGADQDGYADLVLANIAAYDAAAPAGITGTGPVGPLVEEGIAGRVADRLTVRTIQGWQRLAGWLTGESPELAPLVATVDGQVADLTGVASGRGPVPVAPSSPTMAVDGVICPVPGAQITSDWGEPRDGGARTHQGIDLAADIGTPIVAPFPARVVDTIDVEADGGLGGISVWLEATSGPHKGAAVYIAHNRRNTVRLGQEVSQGGQVAELGNTGVGTGPHAHISWAPDGGAFTDPAPIRIACQEATK
ncbi:MAG: M23 family metallopeptidase [Acidimicrobiia bacterium]